MAVTKEVSDFSVEIYDNGFTLKYSGRDDEGDWAEAKLIVSTVDELCDHIRDIVKIPR